MSIGGALGVVAAGVAIALERELLVWIGVPPVLRAEFMAGAYRGVRISALTLLVAVWRRPTSPGRMVALALAWSGAMDLLGAYLGDPWKRWPMAPVLSAVTWPTIGAIVVWWTCTARARPS